MPEKTDARQRGRWARSAALRPATLAVLAALSLAGACNEAFAHATVLRTNPQKGATVTGPLSKVEVWYNAPISPSLAALSVTDAAGQRIDRHDAAIDPANGAHVDVHVNPPAPGEYTVRYRAISSDGHIVSGSYRFTVKGE